MIFQEIYSKIISLILLTRTPEVLWIVLPLILATIIMLVYFEKYKTERPGWNTYVANSLVLLFVSIILLKYIYSLDNGLISYINYLDKTIISFILLLLGIIILFLNFEHFLPEKIAKSISSPLTLNLIAYILVLRIYSNLECNITTIFASLILFILLFIILYLIKIPFYKLFYYMKRLKEEEKKQEIIGERKPFKEKKKQIKKQEKLFKKAKQKVAVEEKQVKKEKIKELDKQKNEAIKLKNLVTKK